MASGRRAQPPARRRGWQRVAVVIATGVVIVAAGGWLLGAAGWWSSVSGTPRVSVDRTDIDLGDLRFDTAARAVFTVSNVGDGTLQLSVPPVEALQGC